MKVAVIGAGTIVPDFLEAAGQIEELEVYAIFGRESSLEKLKRLQDQYQIQCIYHDYAALLADGEVEVVYIALPNHLHYVYAEQAVRSGKHVILEKPFASSYAQAKDLVEKAREGQVVVFEAISNQYMPNYRKTRELIQELGDVKIVQMNYSQYSRRYDLFKAGEIHPVFDPKQSGGALMDINVYNIHYIVGLFGRPETVHYMANIERGVDTSGILTLGYPSFQCVCVGAKDCRAPLSINVQGDKGYIHSDDPSNTYNSFFFGRNSGEAEQFELNGGRPRLYHELRFFADMVAKGDWELARQCDAHSLEVMAILDEARQQVGIADLHE